MTLLFQAAKQMVNQNIKCKLSKEVEELLSLCTLALMLRNQEETFEKMPILFQSLTVLAEDTNIASISQKYRNIPIQYEDENDLLYSILLDNWDIDEKTNHLNLEHTLLISTKKEQSIIELVYTTTGELFRLLRSREVENLEYMSKIRHGLEIGIYYYKDQTLTVNHTQIESGTIARCCEEAFNKLLDYLEDNDMENISLFKRMKEEQTAEIGVYHPIAIETVHILCMDSTFENLLNQSFEEKDLPEVVKYYNNVMNKDSAFFTMSNILEHCCNCYDNNDEENFYKYRKALQKMESDFLTLSKSYKK